MLGKLGKCLMQNSTVGIQKARNEAANIGIDSSCKCIKTSNIPNGFEEGGGGLAVAFCDGLAVT
jgi:hypothetical protein